MREDSLDFDKLGIHLDKTDIRILKLLANDSRISYAEIAREVHLSRMAVRERVMKMLEEGIIERFTVQLNSKKVGLNTPVFLQVKAIPNKLNDVADELVKHPQIESVYVMTGKNELYAEAFVEDVEGLEKFVFEEIYKIEGITEVEYNIITKKYKSRRLFT
ncbi:Lrp/AsnC family transcriptional regulator [Intestinibacter bartlettii]|uniref:Lrp/AsnC family transcriptional regulator n=1 Tax=Intestinibacter bartlettii TaxID=261299 RepID=A0ABS6DT93_9FIRM|nr:Lrp/AsnC family transcriptional regulator [Intestinibacter bartlettii]MBU5334902.1 Lrp/AsnC family transcriptional regulator [Intestinibacter bartlettii]MDO5010521.1 Lrp/AsnC family transcriptional regulator [Intestinibacter bartlettii]